MGQDTEESRFDSWQGEDISSPEPRTVLGLTQSPTQWMSRALSAGPFHRRYSDVALLSPI